MLLNKKFITFGVVVLFIILVFTPITHASFLNDFNSKKNLIQIEISEYNSDGIVENKIFSLTKKEVNELKMELLNSKTIENQLLILKEHRLIPENIGIKDLENGMNKKAAGLGITEDSQPVKSRIKLPILLKFFKKVNIAYFGGVSLNIGLKFIIRFINLLPFINLPTIDFADFCGGIFGISTTRGIFSNNTLLTFPGVVGMIGFVGYRIKFPFLMHIYSGFSAVTFCLGIGLKILDQ
jgi:hypothetical protein